MQEISIATSAPKAILVFDKEGDSVKGEFCSVHRSTLQSEEMEPRLLGAEIHESTALVVVTPSQ
jgi:hypothetical protein